MVGIVISKIRVNSLRTVIFAHTVSPFSMCVSYEHLLIKIKKLPFFLALNFTIKHMVYPENNQLFNITEEKKEA